MSVGSWESILTITVFLISNVLVVFPVTFPILVPNFVLIAWETIISWVLYQRGKGKNGNLDLGHERPRSRIFWLRVDLQSAPLLAVVFLLATRCIDGTILKQGIIGSDGIQPLNIMILFISLAYMSISLDVTGLFQRLAFRIAMHGGGSGRRLFFFLYAFWVFTGATFGNDPVILSGTAFLVYFTRVTGITPPTAWTFSEFAAANTASAILPPSNPTNLVITGAFAIPFLTFVAHTIVPSLVGAVVLFLFTAFWLFRSPELVPREIDIGPAEDIPLHSRSKPNDPSDGITNELPPSERRGSGTPSLEERLKIPRLTDKHGALIGSLVFCATLVILVATSPLRVAVWKVVVPPALVVIARDIWHDRKVWSSKMFSGSGAKSRHPAVTQEQEPQHREDDTGTHTPPYSTTGLIPNNPNPKHKRKLFATLDHFPSSFPTLSTTLSRLPLSLVPFTLSMSILVQAIASRGFTAVFANWWGSWVHVCTAKGPVLDTIGVVTMMMVVTVILCNICGTNIGATILLARVIQTWISTASTKNDTIDPRIRLATIYALALASNFGAFSFSFSASLAGLLWRSILRQKGIHVSRTTFAKVNAPILLVTMLSAGVALVIEANVSRGK